MGHNSAGTSFRTVQKSTTFSMSHVTVFPQANGAAERAVRMAKYILKQTDPLLILLSYRATPIQATGYSPTQLMLGCQIKTPIPTLEEKLLSQWRHIALFKAADSRAKSAYKHHYDRHHSSCLLPLLKPGHSVSFGILRRNRCQLHLLTSVAYD